jgi:signal transduction histidine kinase
MTTHASTITTFRPRARLLSLLGEQLISDQAVGLIELVKNAYDADATRIEVELHNLKDLETTCITLRDNGFGMTRDDIEQKWLSPAVDHKERQKKKKERTPRGRLPIGEKGVGRFAVHQLGRRFQLISKTAHSPEVVFQVNWDDFDSGEVYLDDIPVTLLEREPQIFTGTSTGTLLIMERARAEWTEGMVKKVHRALRRLQSPHQQVHDFTITLRCPDYPAYEQISSSDILERAHYVFRGYVDEKGWLDYEYRCLHPALPERHAADDAFNLLQGANREMASFGANGCGPFHMNFYVWDRTQEYLAQSGIARGDLDAMSGVSLFRDNLRVLPYGEAGNDWLDLDRERINDPSKRIGNQQIIGFVEVAQENTPGLRDKTNREGLIDNIAFRDLRALVRAAINVFTTHWQKDRPASDTRPRARKSALQQARDLTSAMAETARDDVVVQLPQKPPEPTPQPRPISSTPPQPEPEQASLFLEPDDPSPLLTQRQAVRELQEHLKQASLYQDQSETDAEQRAQVLMHLAATGMVAERVAHEFGRQVHAALDAVGKLRHLARGDSEVSQAIRTLDATLGTLRNEFRVLAPYEIGWRIQRTATVGVEEAATLALKLNEHLIDQADITTEIEGDDFEIAARPASLVQVFDNLVHNSCVWLEGHPGPSRIVLRMDGEARTVTVCDTGPGIPSHLTEEVFEPFVTLRNGGRGLGLYITRELLKAMNATITLLPSDRNGTGATFVVDFGTEKA